MHSRGNRPPDVARHYALLDALDYLFEQLLPGHATAKGDGNGG
jgi:hypothetical protein